VGCNRAGGQVGLGGGERAGAGRYKEAKTGRIGRQVLNEANRGPS